MRPRPAARPVAMDGRDGVGSWVRYAVVGAYATYVLLASAVDPGVADLSARGPLGVVGTDTWLHAVTYAVLAVSLAWARAARGAVPVAAVVAVTVAFGGAIELGQGLLAHRAFERGDLAANAVGAAVGAAGWWFLGSRRGRGGGRER